MNTFKTQKMVIIVMVVFTVCTANFFLLRKPNFDDLIDEEYTLETITNVPTLISCAFRCIMNMGCVSVFYGKSSKFCIFKSVLFVDPTYGVFESGYKYYSVHEEGCPKDFVRNRKYDLCYKPILDAVDYVYDARTNCDTNDNVLLRANSVEAYQHVSDQLMVTPEGDGYGYYVDGSDADEEGHWIFTNGNNMTAFIWGDGEPDNYTDSDYIYLKYADGKYIMSDAQDGTYADYICQKLMNEEEMLGDTEIWSIDRSIDYTSY